MTGMWRHASTLLGWVALLATMSVLAAAGGNPGRGSGPGPVIRPPAVAGQFYPGDAGKLTAAVDGFLRDAIAPRAGEPVALVAPHAGYVYSGQIAADAYRQASGHPYDVVVILGTNHTGAMADRIAVYEGAGYRTPLGIAAVDAGLAAALVNGGGALFNASAHAGEHSIEVQLPFVQRLWPGAKIVPVVVGTGDPDACARFGRSLARALRDRRALIVASSDLSHYPNARDAIGIDARTLDAIARLNAGAFDAAVRTTGAAGLATSACGESPIRVLIAAARELGITGGTVVSYANSGDTVAGEPGRVVGYGAVVFSRGGRAADTTALKRAAADLSGALDAADKRVLVRLARETIARYLASDTMPLPRGGSARLLREAGAFVTLTRHGELRGCIGRLLPEGSLVRLVSAMAFESAFNDPRFGPLRANELADLAVEVSVLTPMTPVPGPADIVVGRDGVVLRVGAASAVFLPQVATEQSWTREQMLDNLAVKAGLAAQAWRDPRARFLTFRADAFKESDIR